MDIINASRKGDLERVLQLIEEGTNVNIKDSYGSTALIHASFNGNLEIVNALIKAGANLNIKDFSGSTALIRVSCWNHLNVTKALIEAGANTEFINNYYKCALYYSLRYSNYEISNLLLKNIKNFNKEHLKFKNRGIIFFYLFPFIKKSKKCPINKIPDDLIGLLLKF